MRCHSPGYTRLLFRFVLVGMIFCIGRLAFAQDLAPRAYIITPIHTNAITLSYGFYNGNLDLGNIPITDASARVSVPVLSYFHSLNVFGRTGSVVVSLP